MLQLQQLLQPMQQAITTLQKQMGQIADTSTRREVGQLPSQPVANPRNHPPGFPSQIPHPSQYVPPPQPPQFVPT